MRMLPRFDLFYLVSPWTDNTGALSARLSRSFTSFAGPFRSPKHFYFLSKRYFVFQRSNLTLSQPNRQISRLRRTSLRDRRRADFPFRAKQRVFLFSFLSLLSAIVYRELFSINRATFSAFTKYSTQQNTRI